ncbi:MAG: ComF family protein [Pseudomonadota bacterium]
MKTPRPWVAGRAALLYQDNARQLVLGLKHGQKTEIARAAGMWMQNAAKGILHADALLVPIPLHWTRLLKRSFNQSAVLANALAKRTGHDVCPDLLLRHKRTVPLDQKSAQERFDVLQNSIRVNSRRALMARNRRIILIDDVMTSGATLTAATEACLAVGSGDVFVLTLARVAKDA